MFTATVIGSVSVMVEPLALAKEGLAGYRSAKKDEEQRLFDTVAPFVAPGKNPVQVNFGAPAKPQEGS